MYNFVCTYTQNYKYLLYLQKQLTIPMKNPSIKLLFVFSSLLWTTFSFAGTDCEIYNWPESLKASSRYAVSAAGKDVLVIDVNPGGCSVTPDPAINMGVKNADEPNVALFGADGTVEVKVKFLTGAPEKVEVRPLGKEYKYSLSGDELTLKLKTYDRVSVEADGNIDAPLFIFVNPIEAAALEAAKKDPDTKVYTAGKVYSSDCFKFYSKKIYIQGGAVLDGFFLHKSATFDSEINGCGIIDSRAWDKNTAFDIHNAENLVVRNITVLNRKMWSFRLVFCHNFIVDNVKVVAACPYNDNWDENDGIHPVASTDGLITRCFAYSWDDAYNFTSSFFNYIGEVHDIDVEDCIGWNVHPGNAFEVSWSTKKDIYNLKFKNLYAIHSGTKRPYARSGLSIHHAGPAKVHDLKYENVWVEDPYEYGLAIYLMKEGQLYNISYKNVHILKTPPLGCILQGSSPEHQVHDITFTNLTIAGKKIKSVDDPGFRSEIRPAKNYKNITFK